MTHYRYYEYDPGALHEVAAALERAVHMLQMVTATEWHKTAPMPMAEPLRETVRDDIIPQGLAALARLAETRT